MLIVKSNIKTSEKRQQNTQKQPRHVPLEATSSAVFSADGATAPTSREPFLAQPLGRSAPQRQAGGSSLAWEPGRGGCIHLPSWVTDGSKPPSLLRRSRLPTTSSVYLSSSRAAPGGPTTPAPHSRTFNTCGGATQDPASNWLPQLHLLSPITSQLWKPVLTRRDPCDHYW